MARVFKLRCRPHGWPNCIIQKEKKEKKDIAKFL